MRFVRSGACVLVLAICTMTTLGCETSSRKTVRMSDETRYSTPSGEDRTPPEQQIGDEYQMQSPGEMQSPGDMQPPG